MKLNIPYSIGDSIQVNGKAETIKGIHIYVTEDGEIGKWRFYLSNHEFYSVDNSLSSRGKHERKKKTKFIHRFQTA